MCCVFFGILRVVDFDLFKLCLWKLLAQPVGDLHELCDWFVCVGRIILDLPQLLCGLVFFQWSGDLCLVCQWDFCCSFKHERMYELSVWAIPTGSRRFRLHKLPSRQLVQHGGLIGDHANLRRGLFCIGGVYFMHILWPRSVCSCGLECVFTLQRRQLPGSEFVLSMHILSLR